MKSLFLALLALGFAAPASAQEFIVKLKENAVTAESTALIAQAKRTAARGKFLVVDTTYAEIMKNPAVAYADPNVILRVSPVRKSDKNPLAWGLSKIGSDKVNAAGITGKGVLVAVIDTGIDYNHPELAEVAVKPTKESTKESCTGWNFVANTNDPMDDADHGTHVSGTIGGNTVGVAPGVKIIGAKFLGADGSGTLDSALSAIQYAIDCKVNVMSNSWGGGGRMQSMQDLINDANSKGIVFVAAAGNDGQDNDKYPSYPANYDHVISVAATDVNDKVAYFSQYGVKTVHVSAPGVNVYSSIPGGKYETMDGTSMATPHVSGVVALMLEKGVKPADIQEKLVKSCDKVSPAIKVACKGRVDAVKAVK